MSLVLFDVFLFVFVRIIMTHQDDGRIFDEKWVDIKIRHTITTTQNNARKPLLGLQHTEQ